VFLGDDHLVTAGEDGTVRILDVATGRCQRRLAGHAGPPRHLRVLPGDAALLSADDAGTVALWDLRDGALLRTIAAAPSGLAAISVDAGGRVAVVAGRDRTLGRWDLDRGERTGAWRAEEDLTACAALEGGLAAYGDAAGHVVFVGG
jgi:WD40 repeat protein